MFPEDLSRRAAAVIGACRARGLRLAVAESCTGGLIAGCLTAVPGSSEVLDRAFVTYSNAAKGEMLGVADSLLADFGAVSEQVARSMAEGALDRSRADIAAAVTGIAGPGGGTDLKPVGLVHVATARRDRDTVHQRHLFAGDRDAVRTQAVKATLELLAETAD